MTDTANLIGAVTAVAYLALISAMFSARMAKKVKLVGWLGWLSALIILPLAYLLLPAVQENRPPLYFLWLGLMLAFALFELIADDILKVDLRTKKSRLIPYVVFFFAASGGLLGLASQAGTVWTVVAVILYLVMAVLAFAKRAVAEK